MVDWGGNYPPGAKNDPRAPYNQPAAEECIECGGTYTEGGHNPMECYECGHGDFECGDWDEELGTEVCPACGSEDIEHLMCPNAGMNRADYEEAKKAEAAEMKMDAMREER
ncbi:hypothetical protein [Halomonas sp.]|uniref:hypothetical protein n=1 Tax=Halomonas sp. TaxID=1486246 RepID=UPI003569A298